MKEKIARILRWSEKYTKTDMVYLAHGGFWLGLSQMVASLSSFFLAIAFAKFLPKETYGVYRYILSVAGILTIPTLAYMDSAVIQAVSRGYEGTFIPALKTKIKWGLLGGLASLGTAGYYFLNGNQTNTFAFLIASLFLPFMDSFEIYDAFLHGKKLFSLSAKCQSFSKLTATGALTVSLFFTQNVLLLVLVYFAVNTFARLAALKIVLYKIKPNDRQDPKTIPYGMHLSAMWIISAIAGQIDKVLTFHYLGAAKLAVYTIATSPVMQINSVTKIIDKLALPKLSEKNSETIHKTMIPKLLRLSGLMLLIVICYIFAAPFLFQIVFPKYMESVFYSQIFAFSLVLSVSTRLLSTSMVSQMEQKKLYIFNTLSPALYIIVLFVAIKFYGLLGAVLAQIIRQFINLAIYAALHAKSKKQLEEF